VNASRADFQEATQKVKNKKKHNDKPRIQQGSPADVREPNKIAASTHYDFKGKHLTPYGGLFPVGTMLEKLGFQKLVVETLTVKRIPRVMTIYQFVLGMVLALYVGFARLNHIRFVAQDPMLTGILKVSELPGQSTFWRFLASLNLNVAWQLLQLQRILRERVWEAANVRKQMGARKGYNPKNKGKKSFQPILTFLAETREYVWGELRNGDRPDGKQIARHLQSVFAALPRCIQTIFARADAGFYCWEAVQAYEKAKAHFIIVACQTARLLEQLQTADWKPSRNTDADEQCEFRYQPEGWGQAYRFIALRYEKKDPEKREQYHGLPESPRGVENPAAEPPLLRLLAWLNVPPKVPMSVRVYVVRFCCAAMRIGTARITNAVMTITHINVLDFMFCLLLRGNLGTKGPI